MKYDPCKFHGKFSDLIPAGFEFQKLYANNYRQYCYEITKYGNDIRVWQANGGTVEVLGMSSNATKNLYKMIHKDGIEQFEKTYHKALGRGHYYRWVVNVNTQEIELYDTEVHNAMIADFAMTEKEYDEKYIRAVVGYILNSYRTMVCGIEDMNAVLMMIEKGFVIP